MRLIDADALIEFCAERWIPLNIDAVNMQPTIQPVATDTNVGDTISKFIDGLEEIFTDLRERHVDDSVCGLCEYDGAYIGESGDWCNECPGFDRDDCFKLSDETRRKWTAEIIKALPTIQPERTEERTETHGVCLDAISRKPAIDALDKQIKQCCKALGSLSLSDVDKHAVEVEMASFRAYRGMLKNLPTVQPEPQWIPVSERLPEKGGEYLVSVHHTIGAISVFHPEKDTYVDDVAIMKYYGKFPSTVRAWMPLPKPFEGGIK